VSLIHHHPVPRARRPSGEKRDDERAFRDREVAVKEREQQTKEAELALAQEAHAAPRWKSPLVVAILAAPVAGLGNMLVAYTIGRSETNLEAKKAEQARILEMIKSGSPDRATENLNFFSTPD
jgi:Tfp pilus assembly protein PilX